MLQYCFTVSLTDCCFVITVWFAARTRRAPLWAALGVLVVFSLSAHKEFRFVYSLLFLCLPFCGLALSRLRWPSKFILLYIILTNIPVATPSFPSLPFPPSSPPPPSLAPARASPFGVFFLDSFVSNPS